MLKRHLPNLLSYFLYRITTASSEGFNTAIQALKYATHGFRSFPSYPTRILFFCGKADLRRRLQWHHKSRRTEIRRLYPPRSIQVHGEPRQA